MEEKKLDRVLDCRQIFEQTKKDTKQFIRDIMVYPSLEIILVNHSELTLTEHGAKRVQVDNSASRMYANSIIKDCEELEIEASITELTFHYAKRDNMKKKVIKVIQKSKATSIMLMLPALGEGDHDILQAIPWYKDADGTTTINRGALFEGDAVSLSSTASGIYDVFKKKHRWNIPMEGKHCVIVNRSNNIGKPLSLMFMYEGATVTVCNSHTVDLKKYTQDADILVTAVGKPKFITADMVKPDAYIMDVGTNLDENGKLCGDVDFENVVKKCYVTPVPNGVGLLTRGALLENIAWNAFYQKTHRDEIKTLEALKKNTLWKTPFNQEYEWER